MEGLIEQARDFAAAAHRGVGQVRKYTGEAYEEHLRRVAQIVASVTDDAETIAAAWLHDVVEDTPVTIDDIERTFGPDVRQLVEALTDVSRPSDGNRAARKALDRAHLANAPACAQTVKLADLSDNCADICEHDPAFGRTYLREMEALLGVLTAGDERLQRRARQLHEEWSQRLLTAADLEPARAPGVATPIEPRLRRALLTFRRNFCAADLAEPLPCIAVGSAYAAALTASDTPVLGVTENGRVLGCLVRAVADAIPEVAMRALSAAQVLEPESSLADVVSVLTRHELCFVAHEGAVTAYIGRGEMQGPVARMWLFGMITTLELAMTEFIRARAAEPDWQALVSAARLQKARDLQAERAALGRPAELLDCLQFSDKIRVMLAIDDQPRPLLRGQSRRQSQRLARHLEDLRNSLAHSQDIVTHDWAQIARLAKRLDQWAEGE